MKSCTATGGEVVTYGTYRQASYIIDEEDLPGILSILSDKLYSNRIAAVLREYSCNAWDAHVDAGIPDKPFIVTLPTSLIPELTIRDYGKGLSMEGVLNVYARYGKSTKTHTNAQKGMFGLGAKAAFAYTSAWNVTSYHRGLRMSFAVFADSGGRRVLSETGTSCHAKYLYRWLRLEDPEEPLKYVSLTSLIWSDEVAEEENYARLNEFREWLHEHLDDDVESGLAIKIPVRREDIEAFSVNATRVLSTFEPLPECNVATLKSLPKLLETAQNVCPPAKDGEVAVYISGDPFVRSTVEALGAYDAVLMGNVLYPINTGELEDFAKRLEDEGSLSAERTWPRVLIRNTAFRVGWADNPNSAVTALQQFHQTGPGRTCTIFRVPIGTVEPSPSRESLVLTKQQVLSLLAPMAARSAEEGRKASSILVNYENGKINSASMREALLTHMRKAGLPATLRWLTPADPNSAAYSPYVTVGEVQLSGPLALLDDPTVEEPQTFTLNALSPRRRQPSSVIYPHKRTSRSVRKRAEPTVTPLTDAPAHPPIIAAMSSLDWDDEARPGGKLPSPLHIILHDTAGNYTSSRLATFMEDVLHLDMDAQSQKNGWNGRRLVWVQARENVSIDEDELTAYLKKLTLDGYPIWRLSDFAPKPTDPETRKRKNTEEAVASSLRKSKHRGTAFVFDPPKGQRSVIRSLRQLGTKSDYWRRINLPTYYKQRALYVPLDRFVPTHQLTDDKRVFANAGEAYKYLLDLVEGAEALGSQIQIIGIKLKKLRSDGAPAGIPSVYSYTNSELLQSYLKTTPGALDLIRAAALLEYTGEEALFYPPSGGMAHEFVAGANRSRLLGKLIHAEYLKHLGKGHPLTTYVGDIRNAQATLYPRPADTDKEAIRRLLVNFQVIPTRDHPLVSPNRADHEERLVNLQTNNPQLLRLQKNYYIRYLRAARKRAESITDTYPLLRTGQPLSWRWLLAGANFSTNNLIIGVRGQIKYVQLVDAALAQQKED